MISISMGSPVNASVWTSFTNTNTIRAIAFDSGQGEFILASWGGVLFFDPGEETITVQGRVEGFSSVDVTDAVIDAEGRLILGTVDRGMDIRFSGGTIRNYTDLDGLPSNDVIFVGLNGGDIWAGTTRGAAQLRLEGDILQPISLYFAEPRNLEVREIAFHGDSTAFATNDGLWLLVGESAFEQFTTDDNLLDNSVLSLLYGPNGDLYVGTESGIQLLQRDGTLVDMVGGLSGSDLTINDIVLWNAEPWIATEGGIFRHDQSTWADETDNLGSSHALSLLVSPGNELYAGTHQGGFARRQGNEWRTWTRSGPSANFLTNVTIDAEGTLWTTTWKAPRDECSLGRYDGTTWTSFTESNSDLAYNRGSALSVAPDSTVWVASPWFNNGSHGSSGLSVIDDAGTPGSEDDSWWLFPASSTGLSSDAIRTEVVFEGRDNAWIGSWEQFSDFGFRGGLDLLQDYDGEATFRSFVDFLRDANVNALAMDHQGNLWIGYTEVGVDAFILEPISGTDSLILDIDPDDRFLLSESISDLKVGPNNHLWIASAGGVNEVDFLSNPANRSGYIWRSFTRENTGGGLPDLLIRDIEFQGSRFVWFATPSGVSRYDRIDDRWEVFNEGNSGLLDDRTWDIFVDNTRNHIWIATEKGISRYDPLDRIPSTDITQKITIFPNPFTPASGHTGLSFGPFSSPTEVTIYSLSGRVIESLSGEEEWIRWDGKDTSGGWIPSGVYIVIARSDGSTAKGKFAVIQ
jgi:hypothetical protein